MSISISLGLVEPTQYSIIVSCEHSSITRRYNGMRNDKIWSYLLLVEIFKCRSCKGQPTSGASSGRYCGIYQSTNNPHFCLHHKLFFFCTSVYFFVNFRWLDNSTHMNQHTFVELSWNRSILIALLSDKNMRK